jgi:hypothetical protein
MRDALGDPDPLPIEVALARVEWLRLPARLQPVDADVVSDPALDANELTVIGRPRAESLDVRRGRIVDRDDDIHLLGDALVVDDRDVDLVGARPERDAMLERAVGRARARVVRPRLGRRAAVVLVGSSDRQMGDATLVGCLPSDDERAIGDRDTGRFIVACRLVDGRAELGVGWRRCDDACECPCGQNDGSDQYERPHGGREVDTP